MGATLTEARAFLALPRPEPAERSRPHTAEPNSPEAARRLFNAGRPIGGTLAEAYLRRRGITADLAGLWSLRFHPACYYRARDEAPCESWPALLAAITDLNGEITAVHRTWLARDGSRKAPLPDPRRSLGRQLGSAVRLGLIGDVLTAGEGIETMLSVRSVLPAMPMLAGLSANHLAALQLPEGLRRLYVALDNDPAGFRAARTVRERAESAGIAVVELRPRRSDFNADLRRWGAAALRERVGRQLVPEDRARFVPAARELAQLPA